MAATNLTVQKLNLGLIQATGVYHGTTVTYTAATVTEGDRAVFSNPKRGWFEVKNTNAAPTYVKVVAQGYNTQGHKLDAGSATITYGIDVPATTGLVRIGPFDDTTLIDSTGGVTIICSAITDVTVAAVELAETGRP